VGRNGAQSQIQHLGRSRHESHAIAWLSFAAADEPTFLRAYCCFNFYLAGCRSGLENAPRNPLWV